MASISMGTMSAQLKSLPGWYCYYAGLAIKIHGETVPLERESVFASTLREPLGVVVDLDAIRDFTQVKSVWVELQPTAGDPFSVKL